MKYILLTAFGFLQAFCYGQKLEKKDALEDLKQFKSLMGVQSSYYQLSDFDFDKSFRLIEGNILLNDSVELSYMVFEFEKIISKTLDRHANVRHPEEWNGEELYWDEKSHQMDYFFPFELAPFQEQVLALTNNRKTREYDYFNPNYPYLMTINGYSISDFISKYAYRRNNSAPNVRLAKGLKDIRRIGELYYKQYEILGKELELGFSNGKKDTIIFAPVSEGRRHTWRDAGSWENKKEILDEVESFNYSNLDKWLPNSIGYIGIPDMVSYDEHPDFQVYLDEVLNRYIDAKAIVIDIRGNGGGTREILQSVSKYILQPNNSPWIANVAYVRSDQLLDEDISSMRGKYLFNSHSEFLNDGDRRAIDQFAAKYQSPFQVDKSKFSSPYYMVLKNGAEAFNCPIYILADEESFSAASIFVSAFKGLPNVKIVGATTNGASGRSKYFYLNNSGIRIKLSTMLSFQRNGEPLDGYGTEPDIVLDRSLNQIMKRKDYQLNELIDIIVKSL